MAAASEIKSLVDSEEIAALAVKYQLMSRQTNYLAIDVKADDEKAGDLPALRKTPQMLAAGWGGTGTATEEVSFDLELSGVMYLIKSASAAFKAEQLAEEADILQNFDEPLEKNLGPH